VLVSEANGKAMPPLYWLRKVFFEEQQKLSQTILYSPLTH
jgi:hypothetical protein